MPTYNISDPQTGQTISVTGDSPPSEAEIQSILSSIQVDTPQNISNAAELVNVPPTFTGNPGSIAGRKFVPPSTTYERRATPIENNFEQTQVDGVADIGIRAKLGLINSVESRAKYLVGAYGQDNVRAIDNRLFFRENNDSQFTELDPGGFDGFGDFADASGAAIVTAPAIAGEVIAGPLGAAAGAAIGDGLRQGAAVGLGVEDEFKPVDTLKEGAIAATGAGLFGAPVRLSKSAASVPSAITPKFANRAERSDAGIESRAIEESIGAGTILTTGEATGSTTFRALEDYLRTSPKSSDIADSFEIRRLERITRKLDTIIDGKTPESTGRNIGNLFLKGVDEADKLRSSNFRATLDEAFNESGGQSVISLSNVKSSVSSLINDLDVGVNDSGIDDLGATINKLFSNDSDQLNAKQFQNLMSQVGKMANGKGQILKSIEDKSTRRLVGGRLLSGLRSDLDSAIENNVPGASKLKEARDQFAADSQLVDQFTTDILAKATKVDDFTPEKVIAKFKTASPSEIRKTVNTLKAMDQGSVSDIGKAFVFDMLENSRSSVGDIGADVPNISYAKFATEFNKQKNRLKEVMSGREFKEIENISKVMAKIKGSLGVSPTAVRGEVKDNIDLLSSGIKGVAKVLTQRTSSRQLAESLFNQNQRSAIMTVLRSSTNNGGFKKTNKLIESVGVLTAAGIFSPAFQASFNELDEGRDILSDQRYFIR